MTNSSGNGGGGRDTGSEEGRTMTENIRNKYAAAAAPKKKRKK